MSSFLLNLARRGAGLPVSAIHAPAPSPFSPEVGAPDAGALEADTSENVIDPAPQAPVFQAAPATVQRVQSVQPIQRTGEVLPRPPAIQRFSGAPEASPPAAAPQPARALAPSTPAAGAIEATVRPAVLPETALALPPHRMLPAAALPEEPPRPAAPGLVTRATGSRDLPVQDPAEQPAPLLAIVPAIRPAVAESPAPLRSLRIAPAPAPPSPAPQPPIHVRIGRIEVRGAPPPPPAQPRSAPAAPAPLGFAGYARIRSYRSWPS